MVTVVVMVAVVVVVRSSEEQVCNVRFYTHTHRHTHRGRTRSRSCSSDLAPSHVTRRRDLAEARGRRRARGPLERFR